MKTIAVITDFSTQSQHATIYALHLAIKIRANITVYAIDQVPASRELVLAGETSDKAESETDEELTGRLADFCAGLEDHLIANNFPGTQLPAISFDSDASELVDVMTTIVNNENIVLIVTAPREDEDLAACMLGDPCKLVMDWATKPVIVVPGTAPVRNPEKIAVTAELGKDNIDYINVLVGLMEPFGAEIMVSHLTADRSLPDEYTLLEKELMDDLRNKVDYGRIYYRRILAEGGYKAWKWLSDNKKSDLLVLKREPRRKLKEFFKLGHTPEAAYHITVPIMVIP